MNYSKNKAGFVVPVVLENLVTAGVSLIYSYITGAISRSSLASAGVCNAAMSLISALFAALITGSAVLTARENGKGDYMGASVIVEHTLLLSALSSAVITALLLAISGFLMGLFMPGAEPAFLAEGTVYFRTVLFSLPGLVMYSSLQGILRAVGDSRSALVSTFIMCVCQLGAVYVFTSDRLLNLGVKGVALANVVCRYVCTGYLLVNVFRHSRSFRVNPARIFRPELDTVRRILRIGVPTSIDSLAVQAGYVTINSLMVSMGTTVSGVVNVLNAVLLYTGICQTIGSVIVTTLVGQASGAGDIPGARRASRRTFVITELISFSLCLPVVLFPGFFAGLFTSDPEILAQASGFLWVMIPYCFVAVGVNVCDPSVRAAGEAGYVMWSTLLCVWLIRVPLTLLFCLKLGLGVKGIYAANIIALTARLALGFFRISSPNWGKKEI